MELVSAAHSFSLPPHACRYYAKRCFLGLAENLAKHMITVKDATFVDILAFLDAAGP
jgi:hypothetical protein